MMLKKQMEQLKNVGEIYFYDFNKETNTLFAKTEEGELISITFDTVYEGKRFFEKEKLSAITISPVDEESAKNLLKPFAKLTIEVEGVKDEYSHFTTNASITLKDQKGNVWFEVKEWQGNGFDMLESVDFEYEQHNYDPLFLNPVVISSNLFMNDGATANTMEKLSHVKKDASVVIINNAEPQYGITSVNGFKQYGYTDVQELTVSKEKITEQHSIIKKADLVVLSGGNPWVLLKDLRATNALLYLSDEATLVGVSAGAMVLGEHIQFVEDLAPSYNENNEFFYSNGYDLFDGKIIVPHCDEEQYFTKEQIKKSLSYYDEQAIFINSIDEVKETL